MALDKKISIYNEDCIGGMKKHLRPGSIDIVVTSPPYNIGVKYDVYNDSSPRSEYLEWMWSWGKAVKRVLKDSGSLFLNVGSKPTSPDVPFQVLATLQDDFKLQNVIHWIKSIYIEANGYDQKININVGHYKPINSRRFLNDTHEYIFHLTQTAQVPIDRLALGIPYKDNTNINRWQMGRKMLRCRGNCWFIPYKTIQNRRLDRPHPASFPPQLAENCIKLHGLKKNVTVLDPFMGIGNTGSACLKLGVRFIGFEIDSHYYQTAEKSLKELLNQRQEVDNGA
ncbi:MAG: site-specific DNA-methyltransferase [candidate division Zixibacteria bacterium]|nr:site-specific DNA-methyltransferase [candidate division Zixibacteria bacterium]